MKQLQDFVDEVLEEMGLASMPPAGEPARAEIASRAYAKMEAWMHEWTGSHVVVKQDRLGVKDGKQ